MPAKLREPKGKFQETVRRLAEAAMNAAHHDIDFSEPEAVHEIAAMERAFTNILRGKLVFPANPAALKGESDG